MSRSSTYAIVQEHGFTLLTNHALVLVLIARARDIRMREIASHIGITERAVQRIIDDLTTHGYLAIVKDGRRNRCGTAGTNTAALRFTEINRSGAVEER